MTSSVVTMELPPLSPLPSPLRPSPAHPWVPGCEPGDQASRGGDLATTFDSIGDVVHVTNAGTPPEWRLAPVASIGPKTLTGPGCSRGIRFGQRGCAGPGWERVCCGRPEPGDTGVRPGRGAPAHLRTRRGRGRVSSGASIRWPGWATGFSPWTRAWAASANSRPKASGSAREGPQEGSAARPTFIRFYPVGANEAFRFAPISDGIAYWWAHHSRGEDGATRCPS